MRKGSKFILTIVMVLALCGCSDSVDDSVYSEVASICDTYIEENNFICADSYTVDNISYEIHSITKHKVTDDYLVNMTWYIDFSDTIKVESTWCSDWIDSVKYILDDSDIRIDGHKITHTDENYYDSLFVVVNGGEPYSGYDDYVDAVGKPGTESENPEDEYGHDRFDAVVIAEKIVKDNLKAPSSAEFCKNSEYEVSCEGSTWSVRGYVDAQNPMGAVLRNDFIVIFTFIDNDQYTIDLCSIK